VDRQCRQQFFPELLFEGEGAFVGRQRLVLKCLEFGGDVAFGVLQCLPPAIVVGDFFGVGVGDFDEEAVHLVELDAKVGDPRALAFAGFEFEQESATVVLNTAQFVEFGTVAGADHATFAQQRGGFNGNGLGEQRQAGLRRGQCVGQFIQAW